MAEFGKTELGLNESEEFVIVKKSNPSYVLRDVNAGWVRTVDISKHPDDAAWCVKNYKFSAQYLTPHKSDMTEGASSLIWNSLIGKRKKLAKTKSLYYFLNGLCGRCNADYMFHLGQLDKNVQFNVQSLESAGGSYGPFVDWKHVQDFELHKYNKATKEVYAEPVDFDCHAYARNFEQMFALSMAYGPAVADVAKQLISSAALTHGHIVHTRFDVYQYSANPSWDLSEVPTDKDLYMIKALKDAGLSSSPSFVGPRGFAAVWVEDLAGVEAIRAAYKDKEKTFAVLDVSDLLADSRFDLSLVAPNHPKAATKPARAPGMK